MKRLASIRAALLVLVATGGCEAVERARGAGGAPQDPRDLVTLILEAPGMVSPGEVAAIRLGIRNASDTTVADLHAELFLPAWMEPGPPEPTGTSVTMVSSGEGTTLRYSVADPALGPGESRTIVQPVRIPSSSWQGADISPSRSLRARLLAADGTAVGPTVQTEVAVDPEALAADERAGEGEVARVTGEGVGPLRLGMAEAAVRELPGEARDTSWSAEGMQESGLVYTYAEGAGRAVAEIVDGRVSRIFVADRGPRTAEGIGVGSRFEELRSSYGRVCAAREEGRTVVWFPEKPGISFVLADGETGGAPDADRIPASATVSRLIVRRATDSC
jgi:hypothetical protein